MHGRAMFNALTRMTPRKNGFRRPNDMLSFRRRDRFVRRDDFSIDIGRITRSHEQSAQV